MYDAGNFPCVWSRQQWYVYVHVQYDVFLFISMQLFMNLKVWFLSYTFNFEQDLHGKLVTNMIMTSIYQVTFN